MTMTDTAAIEEQQPAPVEDTTSELPAAPAQDDLEAALSEFEAATAQPEPATDNSAPNEAPEPAADLDQLADLLGPDPKVAELQGQVDTLRAAEYQRAEREAFDKFASDLQTKLPSHAPPDWAKTVLLSMAAQDKNLEIAWKYRGISDVDRKLAEKEFDAAEALYNQALKAPDDPRKQAALRQLEQQGRMLGLIMNSKKIIEQATREVIRRSRDYPKPIDEEATADHNMVAQAIRDGSGPVPVEPPPDFGRMTDQQFRQWKRDNLGWE